MTIYQFLALDGREQAEIVWSGEIVANRIEGEYNLILYQIDSFYVEVWYHIEDNDVRKMRSFLSTEQLLPYLNQIDISTLNE